jgi:hypothetical protein
MVINNSFLYRDEVKTTKSRSYLAVPVDGDASVGRPGVVEFSKMDATFKRVAQHSENLPTMTGLDEAVEQQLEELGAVVFSLIGTIDEGSGAEAALARPVPVLRYDPEAENRVALADDALVISTLDDAEATWREAAALLDAEGHGQHVTELGSMFADAVTQLREEAPRRITPVAAEGGEGRSLLGQIEATV